MATYGGMGFAVNTGMTEVEKAQQVAAARDAEIARTEALKQQMFGNDPTAWDPGQYTAPAGSGTAYDPYKAFLEEQARLKAAEDEKRRTSAFDEMYSAFKQFGIDVDGSGLGSQLKSWIWDDKSEASIMLELRNTKAYNDRFTGMADLIKKGQAIDEATYIRQEKSYREVMTRWELPTSFYDEYKDYGRFIANGVSVKELDDRIVSAKTFLDESAPSEYRSALSLIGVSEGGMLAYVLDGDRAQSAIQKQVKTAAMAGAANQYGFGLDADSAAKYGSTLGDQFNAFGTDQRMSLESTLSQLGVQAANDTRLASIDREQFSVQDTLDAELLNDTDKRLKSQKRGLRENARFSGSSAVTKGSLSRNTGA